MSITTRLGLHKPDMPAERFGDYFSDMYAADLQQIDDSVQIKNVPAAGNIPVYGVDGLLMDSGIAPGELEAGLITSILTDQGMLLYKSATALAALSPDVAGKSLITQGAGADPVFGYPSHGTLTNLAIGDPHTQYVLRTVLADRGDLVYRDATGWQRLPKGTLGKVLMQGADDPYWSLPKLDDLTAPDDTTDLNASTSKHGLMQKYPGAPYLLRGDGSWLYLPGAPYLLRGDGSWLSIPNTPQVLRGDGTWLTRYFDIDFPFGNGQDVIEASVQEISIPINCAILHVNIWEVGLISSSVTCTLYRHSLGMGKGDPLDTFSLSNQAYMFEVDLNITASTHDIFRVEVSGITSAKQIVCRFFCEAT